MYNFRLFSLRENIRRIGRSPARLALVSALATLSVILFALPFSGAFPDPSPFQTTPTPTPTVPIVVVPTTPTPTPRPVVVGPGVAAEAMVSVVEGDAGATSVADIRVTLSHAQTADVTVQYNTADGTATVADNDYQPVSGGVLTILAGNTSGTISIVVNGDDAVEPNETFTVTLSSASSAVGALQITQPVSTVTIINDDAPIEAVDIPLNLGFNLVGIPVRFETPTKFSDLAQQVLNQGGRISSILGWNAGAQTFITWVAVNPEANDKVVEEGRAYFMRVVRLPAGGNLRVTGRSIIESVPLDFAQGFNLINVPFSTPPLHVQLNAGGIDVTWVSASEEDGVVQWASSLAALDSSPNTATDSRGPFGGRLNKMTHHVPIEGVTGGSTIYSNVISGGVSRGPFRVTIPTRALITPDKSLTGSVSYGDGAPGRECVMRVTVTQRREINSAVFLEKSLLINGITDGGKYTLDITNIRQDPTNDLFSDFNSAFQYDANSTDATINVRAECDAGNAGTVSVTTAVAQRDPDDPSIYIVDLAVGAVEQGHNTKSLTQAIGDVGGSVSSILGWNAGAQTFRTWVAVNPEANVFAITPTAGYFVRITAVPPRPFRP